MYKTVRHGENSLQYRILAQQEEGIPNVKRRKLTRGKTAGIITVILLLVCGVIATAVLVPLVLTNDFITLTGTFQKFSVSTLRRSHSGNHVVVIAKKPHGWNSSRQSVLPQPAKTTKASQIYVHKQRQTTIPIETTSTSSHPQIGLNGTTEKSVLLVGTPAASIPSKKTTERSAVTTVKMAGPTEPSGPTRTSAFQVHLEPDLNAGSVQNVPESFSSSPHHPQSPPPWYHAQKWNFDAPSSLVTWSKNRISNNPLSTAIGGFCAVAVIVIMIIVLVKSLPGRNRNTQKDLAESKEDKTRLLKPSARTSDEE